MLWRLLRDAGLTAPSPAIRWAAAPGRRTAVAGNATAAASRRLRPPGFESQTRPRPS